MWGNPALRKAGECKQREESGGIEERSRATRWAKVAKGPAGRGMAKGPAGRGMAMVRERSAKCTAAVIEDFAGRRIACDFVFLNHCARI